MSHLSRKTARDLDVWVSEGLISCEQASGIRQWYEKKQAGPGWGVLVFSGLGAVVIGLGVILLFAYNWRAIPRTIKLLLVYGALACAHGIGLWMFLAKERLRAVGESVCVMGTMFFGAGIWLIAQIYHIDEHFPNAFLIWSAGALILAWAMPSVAQGILVALLMTVWCGLEAIRFDTAMHAAPGAILVLVGLLAWRLKSRLLLAATLPAFLISLVFVMVTGHGDTPEITVTTLLNTSVLLVAAAVLTGQSRSVPGFAPIFSFHGWLVFLVITYILTFPDAAEELLRINLKNAGIVNIVYWAATLVLSLSAWSLIACRHASGRITRVPWEYYLMPLTLIVTALNIFLVARNMDDWFAAAPFNLVLLAIVAGMMTRGCRESLIRPTVIGSLLLLLYAFSRYVDLFDNLLTRGTVFIVVGAAIFGQGIAYSRVKKKKQATSTP